MEANAEVLDPSMIGGRGGAYTTRYYWCSYYWELKLLGTTAGKVGTSVPLAAALHQLVKVKAVQVLQSGHIQSWSPPA